MTRVNYWSCLIAVRVVIIPLESLLVGLQTFLQDAANDNLSTYSLVAGLHGSLENYYYKSIWFLKLRLGFDTRAIIS